MNIPKLPEDSLHEPHSSNPSLSKGLAAMSKDTTDDKTLRHQLEHLLSDTEVEDSIDDIMELLARHVQAARIEELENMPLRNNDDIDWQSDRIAELQAQPLTDKDSV